MTDCFILNKAQADHVRGRSPTDRLMAIDPVQLADGDTYVLAVGVADIPAHRDVSDFLKALPVRPVASDEKYQISFDAPIPEKLRGRGDFGERKAGK